MDEVNKIGKEKTLKEHWNDVKDSFEKGWYKAYPWFNTVATFVLFILLAGFCLLLFVPVEMEAEGFCNSGDIKLDIELQNIVQNMTCLDTRYNATTSLYYHVPDDHYENVTCFKEDYILKHANLKGIDGLNCEGKVRMKMPMILAAFWGDGY